MKANRFEIKRFKAEIKSKEKKDIYKPSCVYRAWTVPFYAVEEYAIECYEADEDGDFLIGSDYDWIVDYKFNEEKDGIVIM